MKVLIIEDNLELSNNIKAYLSKEGYISEAAYNCQQALDKIVSFAYDIIILDLMLPDGSGLEVLQMLKMDKKESGVLIISAKGALDDRIKGLDMGADDYLTKPFHLPELNARLKAIHRRRNFNGNKEISFNEIRIDPDTFEVLIHQNRINLTRKEYDLLLYMIANKNRLLTKQTIAEHLWGDYVDTLDSFDFVYQHIKNLRRKITQAGGNDYISTVYGMGYKFNAYVK